MWVGFGRTREDTIENCILGADRMCTFKRGLFFCGGERSEASVKAAKRFDAAEKSAPFEGTHPGVYEGKDSD
jgi:hypothetical protein